MTSPSLCITVMGFRALSKSGNFFPSDMSSDNISYARLPSLSVKYFSWPGGYSSHFLQPQMLADQLYDLQEKHSECNPSMVRCKNRIIILETDAQS